MFSTSINPEEMQHILSTEIPFDCLEKDAGIFEFYEQGSASLGMSFESHPDHNNGIYILNVFFEGEYINVEGEYSREEILCDDVARLMSDAWNEVVCPEIFIDALKQYVGCPITSYEDVYQFSSGNAVSTRSTSMGIVKSIDSVGVHMYDSRNPEGYKDYTLSLRRFKNWVDEGLYKVGKRPSLDFLVDSVQKSSSTSQRPAKADPRKVLSIPRS